MAWIILTIFICLEYLVLMPCMSLFHWACHPMLSWLIERQPSIPDWYSFHISSTVTDWRPPGFQKLSKFGSHSLVTPSGVFLVVHVNVCFWSHSAVTFPPVLWLQWAVLVWHCQELTMKRQLMDRFFLINWWLCHQERYEPEGIQQNWWWILKVDEEMKLWAILVCWTPPVLGEHELQRTCSSWIYRKSMWHTRVHCKCSF